MSDVYSILQIDKEQFEDFSLQSLRIDDLQMNKTIKENIQKLKSIEQRMFADENLDIPQRSIDEVLNKVKAASKTGVVKNDDWTMRELRIVTYYLTQLQDGADVYNYALELIDQRWRDLFFNGLVFCILNSWNLMQPELRKKTCKLIVKKLNEYQGDNLRNVELKNHANFFDEAGPARMAMLILSKKTDIKEAPLLLGKKPSTISQSFYSDVIVKYFDKVPIDLDKVREVFEVHEDRRTKKLVFCRLVEQAEQNSDTVEQTRISKYINNTLGDVTLSATWAPYPGATEEEAQRLKNAKHLVNLWFTRRIIETFFEVCVQDKARKKFWLKYVDYVSGFRIVGSKLTKRALQNDPRVNTMFHRHFIETNSATSKTSALVLCIKNKVLVEFSDTGALYVYNQGHPKTLFLRKETRFMPSTNDLKEPSIQMLITEEFGSLYFDEEGRMTHQGHWSNRLTRWMSRMVLSNKNTNVSYSDTKDVDVFKAQPLPPSSSWVSSTTKKDDNINVQLSHYKNPVAQGITHSYADNSRTRDSIPPKAYTRNVQSTPTTSDFNKVVYETGVPFTLASDWFFYGTYRVVCNQSGYYLNLRSGTVFAFLREYKSDMPPSGSIRVRDSSNSDWSFICHYSNGRQFIVGYVKRGGGGLLYKQEQSQRDFILLYDYPQKYP